MGEVYAGHDPLLKRSVVVKRLRPGATPDASRSRLLKREAQLQSQLSHPNIVRVFDFVSFDGVDHIVSELVEGQTLTEAAPALSWRERLQCLVQVARAMSHSHAHGVLHRDLKAENVLVTRDGIVKVTDFGLSQSLDPTRLEPGDDAAGFSGTPLTMAPEQLRGESSSPRSDMFAFGVLVFETLAGRHPFRGRTDLETIHNVSHGLPTPLRAAAVDTPIVLSELVDRMLAKTPEARPSDFGEVLLALTEVLRAATAPPLPSSVERRQLAIAHLRLHPEGEASRETYIEALRIARNETRRAEGLVMFAHGREFIAAFGYPTSHERNVAAAMSFVESLRETLVRRGIGVSLSVGVDQADAAIHVEEDAVIVSEAIDGARTQAYQASPGRTLAASRVRAQLVASGFRAEPYHGADAETRAEAGGFVIVRAPARAQTELIGRTTVLEPLTRRLRACIAPGSTSVFRVAIVGEAGIGKSTLLERLLREVGPLAEQLMSIGALPNDRYSPYATLGRLVEVLFGIGPGRRGEHPHRAPREQLEEALRPTGRPFLQSALAEVTGCATAEDRERLRASGERSVSELIARQVGDYLAERLMETPSLLVLEDLHWADQASLGVLGQLIDRTLRGAAILVSFRPDELRSESLTRALELVLLQRLGEEDATNLVRRLLPPGAPANVVRTVVERAGGVPLWLEELAEVVREDGELPAQRSTAPTTLRDSVQRRLDLVGRRARHVAELAAAFGGDISVELLAIASEQPRAELISDLDQLARRGLVHLTEAGRGPRVGFRHALTEAAIYQSAEPRWAGLHRALCTGLASGLAGLPSTEPTLFAYHHERAGDVEVAAELWLTAAESAAERWAHDVAVEHIERSLQLATLLAEGPQVRAMTQRARRALGLSLAVLHGLGSRQVAQNAARRFRAALPGEVPNTWPEVYLRWAMSYVVADVDGMATWTGVLQELATAAGQLQAPEHAVLEYLLTTTRGLLHYHAGELTACIETIDIAVTLRPAAMPMLAAFPEKSILVPYTYSAMSHALLGNLDAARQAARWDYERFEAGSVEQLTAASFGALTYCFLRDQDEMREFAQAVSEASPLLMGPTHIEFCRSLLLIGKLRGLSDAPASTARDENAAELASQLLAQLQASSATGMKIGMLLQQCMIIEAALEAVEGRPDSPHVASVLAVAQAVAAQAYADLESPGVVELSRYCMPEARGILARLAARVGDRGRADAEFEIARRDVDIVRERSGAMPRLLDGRLRERANLWSRS